MRVDNAAIDARAFQSGDRLMVGTLGGISILDGGNVTAAAKASKMTRQNFQRLMKKYGVKSPPFRK